MRVNSAASFKDRHDRRQYLRLIAERLERGGVGLSGYCLLGDRIKLIARAAADGQLERVLREAQAIYAEYYRHSASLRAMRARR